MRQKSLLKFLFLSLALTVAGVSNAWADTSTVNASKVASSSATWTGDDDVTWSVSVTGGATNQNVTSGYAQVGTKASPSTSVTFSTSGISGNITSIVVDCASYSGAATLSATVGGNAFGTQNQSTPSWSNNSGGDVTFTGSASGEIVVTMTNGSGGRAMYIHSITVTYSNPPSDPTFSPESKNFSESFNLTLSCVTDGASIYYTIDGTTPTDGSTLYTEPIAISATTTVKAIAKNDGLFSNVASATYTYIDASKIEPTFNLSTTSLDLKVNETGEITLTTNSDGNVTFNCDDDNVEIEAEDSYAIVSAKAAGIYIVNVSVSETSTYQAHASSVILNVTQKSTTIAIDDALIDNTDVYISSEAGTLTATVKTGEITIAGALVTWTSSNTDVATVASDGSVTLIDAGSTTITATYEGTAEYASSNDSYELTVINTAPQATTIEVSTNYSWLGVSNGGSLSNATKKIDCDGVTVTIKNNSGTYTRGDATYIRLYTKNSMQLEAPTGYNITQIAFTAYDSNWDANPTLSSGKLSGKTWKGDATSVTFTYTSQTRISDMTITLAPTVSVSNALYASYVALHQVNIPEEITAYIATSANASTVTLTQANTIPAGTPIIIKATEAGTYSLTVVETEADDVSANLLQVSDGDDGVNDYVLYNGAEGAGFYKWTGAALAAGRVYLPAASVPAANAGALTIVFADESTGISAIDNEQLTIDNPVYNLRGQRVSQPTRGLYIKDGRKYIVK